MRKLAVIITAVAIGGFVSTASAQNNQPFPNNNGDLPRAEPDPAPPGEQIGPSPTGQPERNRPIPFEDLGNIAPERRENNGPSNFQIGPNDQGRPPRDTPIPFEDLGNNPANQTPQNFQTQGTLNPSGFPVYPDPYLNYGSSGYYNDYRQRSPGQDLADIIRSRGQATVDYSRAALNMQEAYSRYLDNSLKYVHVYWARKAIAQRNLQSEYQETRERREDYLEYQQKMAELRPALTQLDPSTGDIDWPIALQTADYVAYRDKLEELFELRATATSSVPGLSNQIYKVASAMQEVLKMHIEDLPPNDYLEARKFLDGVKYEARYPDLN